MTAVQKEKPAPEELKILAEGFHSSITNPFVAVLRDAETYSELRKLDDNLPKLDADYFKDSAVVAAFLGERNTGGYAVDISSSGTGDIRILERKPGKGVMVPQMITSPFKIVAVDGRSNAPVEIELDNAWQQRLQTYDVRNGSFTMSGGFAGISEQFKVTGVVGIIREGNLATLQFRIVSSDSSKKHSLTECATGVLASEGKIRIRRMSADSLVNSPNSGFEATGTLKKSGEKLTLNFMPRPSLIADGYGGGGVIEAERAGPAPKP